VAQAEDDDAEAGPDQTGHCPGSGAAHVRGGGGRVPRRQAQGARRFGTEKALGLGSHLPSNAEIHLELGRLIALHEPAVLPERLLRLRLAALRLLEMLESFHPYLVGSVLSGAVTAQSDIDLHLFADSPAEVEEFLRGREIPFEAETVTIRHGAQFIDYPHIYFEEEGVVVECTVYPPGEIRRVPKSSITGRAMERAGVKALKKLIAATVHAGRPSEEAG